MVVVVVALGANNIRVPCMLFPTKEAAEQFLTEKLGNPVEGEFEVGAAFSGKGIVDKGWRTAYKDATGRWQEHKTVRDFFTHYYNGCGSADAFVVIEVPYGTPFVPFDLD